MTGRLTRENRIRGRCRLVFANVTMTILSNPITAPVSLRGGTPSALNRRPVPLWLGEAATGAPLRGGAWKGGRGLDHGLRRVLSPVRNDAQSEPTVPRANGIPAIDPRARVPVLPVLHRPRSGRAGQPERGRHAYQRQRRA